MRRAVRFGKRIAVGTAGSLIAHPADGLLETAFQRGEKHDNEN
jgi:hypothetical protein